MITTDYLKRLGFKEEESDHYLVYYTGGLKVFISTVENGGCFYFYINGTYLGALPDDKIFLEKLVEYFGKRLEL